ncbi:unnamed protein product, partial [Polarella glacialis]
VRLIVLLPWDLQLTSFPELYALGVPLLLPSSDFLSDFALRVRAKHARFFWSIDAAHAGLLPGPWTEEFMVEPWLRNASDAVRSPRSYAQAKAQISYWLAASDYEVFGSTYRFSSVAELVQIAAWTTPEELFETSRAMRAEWKQAWLTTGAAYDAAIGQLLGCGFDASSVESGLTPEPG